MPEHPLLLFPRPGIAERARRFGGAPTFRTPGAQEQSRRLAPKFGRLDAALNRRKLELRDNPYGIEPEQVLVLETIGPVADFFKVVNKIDGLEWLGEFDIEDIEPEFGFEQEKDHGKLLDGQVFLIMTDQRALQELQNLFRNWQENPDVPFPRGFAPLKTAFAHLRDIRPWDVRDRLAETGVLEDWKARINDGQEVVPFEAELWFREDPERRAQASSYITGLIQELGGEVVQQSVIPEIAYHSFLGRIPIASVPEIANVDDIKLFTCEDLMHLRPVGQCAIDIEELTDGIQIEDDGESTGVDGFPVVALLDGLPLAGHLRLQDRLIIDDPDGIEDEYQASERVHGTAMASVLCHGDLNGQESPLTRPVYVRPVMVPKRNFFGNASEAIPENVLAVDLIHRSVKRIFESDGTEEPVAPTIRIINLSIGDLARSFDRGMSAWARLLDWLSFKYNVLFMVSAGNYRREIELSVARADLGGLPPNEREAEIIRALASDTRHRRLLSPAETLNGVTVGAAHYDEAAPVNYPNLFDPYLTPRLPSAVNAHGPGFRRAIKPDLLLPGGRLLFSERLDNANQFAVLRPNLSDNSPGILVASPGAGGELDRCRFTRGTSNSAALASRWGAKVFELIDGMRNDGELKIDEGFDPVLIKTLLIHGADWSEAGDLYERLFRNNANANTFRDFLSHFLGYGYADVTRVLNCTDSRVTIFGFGELNDGDGHEFEFPLPPSLAAVAEQRRMTFTLAWISPILPTRQKYRVAHLYFDPKNALTPDRICSDFRAVQRGTVQHEILEGHRALDFQDGESIGIKVSCRTESGRLEQPVRYGLAVTLEVAEGIEIPIYQEIEQRLRVRIPITGSNV